LLFLLPARQSLSDGFVKEKEV